MEQGKAIPIEVLSEFDIPGKILSIEELKRGHINRTYVATWGDGLSRKRYIHQVVNHRIFQNINGLMQNLEQVTATLKMAKEAGGLRADERTLTLVKARAGSTYLQDDAGEYWRTFDFIEDTVAYDVCPNPAVAAESAGILGRFQRALLQLDPSSFADTIPFFVDGSKRFQALESALLGDPLGRVAACRLELDFALERRDFGGSLIRAVQSGAVPMRVAHNDMKLNNVLFDSTGKRAVCLLDLDTCMAGTIVYDFGDLVRNTAVPCAEDEQDFSKVRFDMNLYQAICHGYLQEIGAELTAIERELLPVAPRVLALILGVRFLTDYILGDSYFRIHRPNQNYERARTQFQIVRMLEGLESQMRV